MLRWKLARAERRHGPQRPSRRNVFSARVKLARNVEAYSSGCDIVKDRKEETKHLSALTGLEIKLSEYRTSLIDDGEVCFEVLRSVRDKEKCREVMESPAEIVTRWRYLRDLLIDQLGRFESGALQMHSNDENVSASAIAKLKRNIIDFDELIARSVARDDV